MPILRVSTPECPHCNGLDEDFWSDGCHDGEARCCPCCRRWYVTTDMGSRAYVWGDPDHDGTVVVG